MKNRRYLETVEFIALNDEPTIRGVAEIKGFISVITASVAFGLSTLKIARDVEKYRAKEEAGGR